MKVRIRQENTDDFNTVFEANKLAFRQDNEANLVDLLRKNKAINRKLRTKNYEK